MKTSSESSTADALAARSAVWTRHWATGAAHSCVGSYGDRYGGATAEFWRVVFAPLTAAQRVLDLATGSGALPRLLLDFCPDTPCEVDAVDLAAIEPAWLTTLPHAVRSRVRLNGNQPIEALPFADATFDLIVSQYGIEYSDLDRSIPEMLRVLAPGGRVALLMHAIDSRPVTLAAVELAHLKWLMSDSGLLPATATMLEPISRAGTAYGRETLGNDPAAEAARKRFNAAQDMVRARATVQDGADVLFEVQTAVAEVLGLAAARGISVARSRLDEVEVAARDSGLRLQQLRDHALTQSRCVALCQSLHRAVGAGGAVTRGEVREHGYLMGWTVVAQAAAASDS